MSGKLHSIRSGLYKTARVLGDLNAAGKGPGAFARRILRKKAIKGLFSLINNLSK